MSEVTPLPYATPIDLSNCEREPIHVPGHVQGHGAMLVLCPETLRIQQVSNNVQAMLGVPPEGCVGQSLAALLGPTVPAVLQGALASTPSELIDSPRALFSGEAAGAGRCDVVAHLRHGSLILELEPRAPDEEVRCARLLDDLRSSLRRLGGPLPLREYCQRLAAETRALTGYDRVMVYRFAADWHGWVYAESMRDGLHPFLDLHYPASDIPAQARQLFLANRVRLLVDASQPLIGMTPELLPDGSPVDMSYTFLRGASRMYTEYLQNMGVAATLTLALPRGGRLWGLIACHHYDGPKHLGHAERAAVEVLSGTAALRVAELLDVERGDAVERLRRRRQRVEASLADHEDMYDALAEHLGALLDLWPADGLTLFRSRQDHRSVGDVPALEGLCRIVEQLKLSPPSVVVHSDRLSSLVEGWEPDVAAGVLAIPIDREQGAFLMWFRKEQRSSVHWAGDPHKPVTVGPLGDRLTPRKSFELWTEEVHGQCEPWTEAEVDSANKLRLVLGDVVLRERSRLRDLTLALQARNRELDTFNSMASHDLREPLRAISNYAAFIEEDAGALLPTENADQLARIKQLVARMYALIEGLLAFSRMGAERMEPTTVSVERVVRDVLVDLASRIQSTSATVTVLPGLGALRTWELGLQTIFANLIGNALKYSDGPPSIEIGPSMDPSAWVPGLGEQSHVYYVRDHGIGIDPEHRESIFRIFQRLHPDNRYGEGTGSGLPIVRRVAERLGGRVWVRPAPNGSGSIFYVAVRDLKEAAHD